MLCKFKLLPSLPMHVARVVLRLGLAGYQGEVVSLRVIMAL